MALKKSHGFHSLGTNRTIKQGRRRQWSAGNGSNTFQSYASSGVALSGVRTELLASVTTTAKVC